MTKLNKGKASVLALMAVFAVSTFLFGKSLTSIFAKAGDVPKAYCHAAGQSGTLHFNYHFNKAWTSHFLDNGSPKAGHESDFYTVAGDRNCDGQVDSTPTPEPTVTPEPTSTPEATSTPEGTPEGTATPSPEGTSTPQGTATPEATPTPELTDACPNLDGMQEDIPEGYHYDNDFVNCLQYQLGGPPPPTNGGQVLGASTMAGTGSFTENLYLAMIAIGSIMTINGILTFKGIKNFAKASKKG